MKQKKTPPELRVAIIAPPYPLEEAPAPPLGVCYVAAAFERAGAKVAIFDFVVKSYEKRKLLRFMEDFQPHVVGSTSVTMSFPQAARIITDAKEIDPEITTVMGGPHVSFWAEPALRKFPALDLVVLGEGEETIAELGTGITDRKQWAGVQGLAFLDGGQYVDTGRRPFIKDLDSLPMPARHLLPIARYQALGFPVSVITSRGCPNGCIFCLGRRMVGHKVRYRSVEKVVDEIQHLLSLGFDRINIADDLFTSNKKRVAAFCTEIKNRGLDFAWSAFSRVNTIDEPTIRMMRDAGCDCVSFGVESGDETVLKNVKKNITVDQVRRAADICKKAGMMAHASFMVGLPGETMEGLEKTDALAQELDVIYGYHFLAPFPGTVVWEKQEEYQLDVLTTDWALYDANRPVVQTPNVTAGQAREFVGRFDETCRLEWERMEEAFNQGTATPEEGLRILGNRKLDLVFSIISEDLIEKFGPVPENGKKPIEQLAELIAADLNRDGNLVNQVVKNFLEQGRIQVERTPEGAAFHWAENPAGARFEG